MKAEIIKTDGLTQYMKFTIASSEIDGAVRSELAAIAKNIKLPGFRPGKVPMQLIERRYFDASWNDSSVKMIQEKLEKAIEDKKLSLASKPVIDKLENKPKKDCTFEVEFELMPKIEMPDLSKITLDKPEFEVSKEDIDSEIENIKKNQQLYIKAKTKPAEQGDMAVVSYSYLDDDGKTQDAKEQKIIVGRSQLSKELDDALIGKSPKDKFSVKIPAGDKKIDFNVELHKILTLAYPTKPEQIAESLFEGSIQKLHENITKKLEKLYGERVDLVMREDFFEKLGDILSFDVPRSMLESEENSLKSMIEHAKLHEDEESESTKKKKTVAPKKQDKDKEEFINKLSARRVRGGLVLSEYAKLNGINVDDKEMQSEMMKQAPAFNYDLQKLMEFYKKNTQELARIKVSLLEDKALSAIFDKEIKVKPKKYDIKKLDKFLEKNDKKNSELFGF